MLRSGLGLGLIFIKLVGYPGPLLYTGLPNVRGPEVHIPRIKGKKIRAPHTFRFGELYAIGRIDWRVLMESLGY